MGVQLRRNPHHRHRKSNAATISTDLASNRSHEEAPKTLAYSPAIKRFFRWTSVGATLVAATFFGVTLAEHNSELRRSRDYENFVATQTVAQTKRIIQERVDQLLSEARSLAENPEFVTPSDDSHDGARFMPRDRKQAGELASYDHVTTWLETEHGPSATIAQRKLPGSMALWQISRGLPIRSPGGILLAKGRRRLAAGMAASDTRIRSVAELDGRGRVLFLYPYTLQTELTTFDLSNAMDLSSASSDPRVLFNHLPTNSPSDWLITALVPLLTNGGKAVVTVSANTQIQAVEPRLDGRTTSFAVLGKQGQNLMYSGDRRMVDMAGVGPAELSSFRPRATDLSIGGKTYTLVTVTPTSGVNAAIEATLGVEAALFTGALAAFEIILWRILRWLTREQWKRDRLRAHTEEAAQDLAHDLRKPLLVLRTTKDAISPKLAPNELKRLESAIIDITSYSDNLARNLVADAFALPEVPGGTSESLPEATSYVRGVLANVIDQQGSILKRHIALTADSGNEAQEPFASITSTDLTRIVSNLLENSTDACNSAGTNTISASIRATERWVCIQIADDGCGIDEAQWTDLFNSNYTTKGEGRGTGLNNSQKLARKWGGDLKLVSSSPGKGTQIELRLPIRPTPPWFFNKLTLTGKSVLVVVDDEGPVCDYWSKRFHERLEGINLPADLRPKLELVRRAEDLINNPTLVKSGTHFFVDYKFDGEALTGVDVIERLALQDRAVLVTNHFERAEVINAVERLGIKLLPKTHMFNVEFPIEIGGRV